MKYFELLLSIFCSESKVFSLPENIAYLQLLLTPEAAWRISTFRNKWACLARHKFVYRCHQVLLGYNRRHHLRNRTHIYWQLFRLSRIIFLEKKIMFLDSYRGIFETFALTFDEDLFMTI